MLNSLAARFIAVWQALLVTFLWSTSWVLIKYGLADIPALTFAGLRYTLAFVCLLPFVLRPTRLTPLRQLSRLDWGRLIGLGLLFYTVTQGAQFLALAYLPAVTTSLLLNFTTVVVALFGIVLLAEQPTWRQWLGVAINLAGSFLYFYPLDLPSGQLFGVVVALTGVLANAGAALLGRRVNRDDTLPPMLVTVVSMGFGAGVLLALGMAVQGLPCLGLTQWAIIGWLAIVNTAFAFTLWNQTLRTLSAVQSSIINSTMLIQIAVLAWFFLGEAISAQEGLGMMLAGVGVLIVQLKQNNV